MPPGSVTNVAAPARSSARGSLELRSCVLVVFYLGVVGVAAELVLLGHFEDIKQWIPLGFLAASLAFAPLVWRARRATLRLFQALMWLFVFVGVLGIYYHYSSNAEFELEMVPSIRGLELIKESLTGAMPALAPGAMAHLGLLGLAFSFRHPAWRDDASGS